MAYKARGWGGTNDDDGDHSCNDPRNNAAMVVAVTAAAASSFHVLVPPLHPMQARRASPPRVGVVRFASATSPSAVGRAVLLILLVVDARWGSVLMWEVEGPNNQL
jgi:hypothetical protein